MENQKLKGKSAVVTGARRGIGRAIAIAYAAAGADVAICDIVGEDGLLDKTRTELEQLGSKSAAYVADVSRRDDVEEMTRQVRNAYGKIDILANCAGVWIPGQNLIECSDENWDKVIDTNLKGTYLCCRAAGKVMVAQGSGSIINMSSQVGLTPGAGAGAYSISKAGIIMMTRQLALELAEYRIRVNALAPGVVKTDFNAAFWKEPAAEKKSAAMVPLGRLAVPEDIASAALFLASDDAGYITGQVLAINGGWAPSSSVRSAVSGQ
ncbi:MAG: SDR family oxidoreductase [Acidobacteria bacterium]|nr:SDR family oxidoreductase [Acidobacteriota bacterium]